MIVTVLQHSVYGGPGVIGDQLRTRGVDLDIRHVYADDPVPTRPPEALMVMGGRMCTDEKAAYPFLQQEADLLAKCVAQDTPTLAICLGAQLLAEVTGGSVHHDTPEIGFAKVRLTEAGRDDPLLADFADGTPTFNAHQDFITVGPDAIVLAEGDRSPVHALRVGRRVYAIQFHPEMDAERVARYCNADQPGAYLRRHGWEPQDLIALAQEHTDAHARMGRELADLWLDRIVLPVAG